MNTYLVQIWGRQGPRRPANQPEVRALVWEGEVLAETGLTAAALAANHLNLKPEAWYPRHPVTGKQDPRPPYVVRVWPPK